MVNRMCLNFKSVFRTRGVVEFGKFANLKSGCVTHVIHDAQNEMKQRGYTAVIQ
jgi:hypothetical protein